MFPFTLHLSLVFAKSILYLYDRKLANGHDFFFHFNDHAKRNDNEEDADRETKRANV